ncbi:IclR family transcriptional regulator [Paenibacillus sp. IB182496]|uniref:Glycerol operon regulatory protein n=1 Tax=Paenibacillus sabuli TaxID=2772509 RepID=A0A927GSB1_9BACL|nr:IclR family transcriptional regulator [Paenibacillus sabuli]MBD2846554.1 IclR family transcriptional regulator [Paenibacillus sabuli]
MPIIQSVERALQILDLFDEYRPELKITEISAKLQLHKSTVHSLLKTLQAQHYIQQNPENGKYRLGLKLLERSSRLIESLDIRQVARGELEELCRVTGQTVHLVVLDGREGVYIDKVEGPKAVIRYSRIGKRIPLHSSAVGKALIADALPEKLEAILAGYTYAKHTERTLTSESALRAELERVREQGYAVDDQENEPGVYCIAVPIHGYTGEVAAAMSISMLIARVSEQEREAYAQALLAASERLSARLGGGLARRPGAR